jgi:hypothetical protein
MQYFKPKLTPEEQTVMTNYQQRLLPPQQPLPLQTDLANY